MSRDSSVPTPTSTWPRKRHDGRPIVGYQCRRCNHETELFDNGDGIAHECPNCAPRSTLTAVYDREPSVRAAVDQLRDQLAEHHAIACPDSEPVCTTCGTTTDVTLDPGIAINDLQWRCEDHHRFGETFWYLPGDWPTLIASDRLYQCDCCGAEYPLPFGAIALDASTSESAGRGTTYHRCFTCLNAEWLRAWFDV